MFRQLIPLMNLLTEWREKVLATHKGKQVNGTSGEQALQQGGLHMGQGPPFNTAWHPALTHTHLWEAREKNVKKILTAFPVTSSWPDK